MEAQPSVLHDAQLRSLRDVLREHVIAVLTACHGNRTVAARALQVDRKTIYRMLQRWSAQTEDPTPMH